MLELTPWRKEDPPLHFAVQCRRVEWVVPASFKDGREHVVYLEMACNGMFGKGPGRPIFENNAGGDSI
ncbi:hypothetical protein VD0004_g6314 [Verticillium dahliae]|nr:hypothetical protein VD0004_g6314 [Verticillium dahliae]